MAKSFLRTEIGERVEQRDFQHAVETSQRDAVGQVVNDVIVGEDSLTSNQPKSYVLSGFETDNPTGTVVRVTRGTAILGLREKGEALFGCMLSGGDAERNIDLASFTNLTTFGVFIRFDSRDANFENRLFWNGSPTPTEVARSIATRREENWSLAIELTSPGPEWLYIADVQRNGATVNVTDKRDFFFEGRADLAFDPNNEWGSASDRNSAREIHGIYGFRRFVRAIQSQLAGIIGGNWYDTPSPAASGDFLLRNGSLPVAGNFAPDANEAYNWGASLFRFLKLWVKDIDASGTIAAGVAVNAPTFAGVFNASGAAGHAFSTPPTFRHWVSGCEFIPDRFSNPQVVYDNAIPIGTVHYGAIAIAQDGVNGLTTAECVIRLPQGATLTSIEVNGYTNGSSESKIGMIRQKHDLDATDPKWESIFTSATPGGSNPNPFPRVTTGTFDWTTPLTYSGSALQNTLIDNDIYKYIFKITAEDVNLIQFWLSSIVFSYTLPALKPA